MIYLDVGCHDGHSIMEFYQGRFGDIDPKTVRQSVGIDPLGDKYLIGWEVITRLYGTVFMNKAAYVRDGQIEFSEMPNDISSTVIPDKLNFATGEKKLIDCFDFSAYVKSLDEEVVMRMDIEGAEYEVLEKMFEDGTIERVKYLEIEFHGNKMVPPWTERQEKLVKKLRASHINFKVIV